MFKLSSRSLIERFQIERIFGSNIGVGEQCPDVTTEVSLMFDYFIKGDLVLDQECNLDIQLGDVLICHFILANLLDYSFAHSLELNFLVKVEVTVIEKMYEAFQSAHWRVLARCKTLVSLPLDFGTHDTLDLDDLLHVLTEKLLLFCESSSDHTGSSYSL